MVHPGGVSGAARHRREALAKRFTLPSPRSRLASSAILRGRVKRDAARSVEKGFRGGMTTTFAVTALERYVEYGWD